MKAKEKIVCVCGGIGGAKLADGLARRLSPEQLTIIVNTGDDFRHFGLHVSPDIDTVTYTLAGRANPETGWGRDGESWRFMEAVEELGGETWFSLGDTDIATKAVRTNRLAQGARLTTVAAEIANALGVRCAILPATDDPMATVLETDEGILPFQRYFVERRWQPVVRSLRYEGSERARISTEVQSALEHPDLAGVIICPSNPYLSIDPILAVGGMREALSQGKAPVVAVSPLVGGQAVKGPLAKMMRELGHGTSLQALASHYAGLIDLLIADTVDEGTPVQGAEVKFLPTVMQCAEDRVALAESVLRCLPKLEGKVA